VDATYRADWFRRLGISFAADSTIGVYGQKAAKLKNATADNCAVSSGRGC